MEDNLNQNSSIKFQRWIAVVGVLLLIGKIVAWKMTNSDSVFSDAMESIVNVISAFMGLYALYLGGKPRDENHPYGHGKVEFVTSAIEGSLIGIAGIMILYEGSNSLLGKKVLNKLDWGIWIIAATAIANYILGYISIQKGKAANSIVLISSGKHLQSDTISTLGVVLSLIIVYYTKVIWIDSVVALGLGIYIIVIGYKIIRESLSGIMDEAHPSMLETIAEILNKNQKPEWIDVHNMKIQQFGSKLHIDAHITLPWYFDLRSAHNEMEKMIKLIAQNTDRVVEFNFHMDDCKPKSCFICEVKNCPARQFEFSQKLEWTGETISQPSKHCLEN